MRRVKKKEVKTVQNKGRRVSGEGKLEEEITMDELKTERTV